MTELLENSDNTNADTGVSESPANEATISLAVAQSLADALQKIESYTPTVWVDNESPDIDAVHLNKAEQAIMRVTTAMNSAVDVIKDLQSQVNTTNNNLSNANSQITQLYSDLKTTNNKITYEEKSFTISFDVGIKGMKIGENMKDGYMPVSIQPVSLPRSTTAVYSFMINSSGEIWAMINSSYKEENVTIKLGFLWMKN